MKGLLIAPLRLASIAALALAMTIAAEAQDRIIYVDIENGSTSGNGQTWNTATKFLQDALAMAEAHHNQQGQEDDLIEIWVAAGKYRPDQYEWAPNGTGNTSDSFVLRSRVRILGGFSGAGTEISEDQRDWQANPTILSGDFDDAGKSTARGLVHAERVNASAVLDGFIIRGGIELRSAQPRFRDCVIDLHEGAAVRCENASHAVFHRCTFLHMNCEAIVLEGASRLDLLLCEPAAILNESHTCGRAHVAACSQLFVVDQSKWNALVGE